MARQPKVDLKRVLPKKQTAYDPAKQVAGLKKRLGASALPSAKVEDGRNPIERALNLRPDQNVFFDVLEVLDRPRSAIAGAAVAGQTGRDIGEALVSGITGKTYTSWKEYLVNTGLEDKEGKIDFVDVAGTLMNMFVDPMNIPLWSVSAFAGKAKASVIEATKVGEKMSKALKTTDALTDLTKVADFNNGSKELLGLADKLKTLLKSQYGEAMSIALNNAANAKDISSFNSAMSAFANVASAKRTVSSMRLVGRGAQITVSSIIKGSDKAITGILGSLDSLNMKTGGAVADDIVKYAKEITHVNRYKTFKTFIASIFDKTAVLGDRLVNRTKMTTGKAAYFVEEGKVFMNMNGEIVESFAKASGRSSAESASLLMKGYEYFNTTGQTSIKEMLTDKDIMTKIPMSADELTKVKAALTQMTNVKTGQKLFTKETIEAMFNLGTLENGTKAYFFNPKNIDKVANGYSFYLKGLERAGGADESLFKVFEETKAGFEAVFEKARFYSADDIAQLQKLQADPVFMSHLEEVKALSKSIYSTVDDRLAAMTVSSMYEKGMVPHTATPDAQKLFNDMNTYKFMDKKLKGNIKVGADRIYKMSAYEANMVFKASAKNILDSGVATGKYKAFLNKASNTQLFTEYINTSFSDWITKTTPTFMQSKILSDMMVVGTFSDPSLVGPARTGVTAAGATVPIKTPGMITQSKAQLIQKLKDMARYQSNQEPFNEAIKVLRKIKGDAVSIDANVFDLIGINTKGSVGGETLLQYVDMANNAFKKFKLLSPGFHMRNFVGNLFNMIVGGVDPTKTLTYQTDVFKIMTTGSDLIEKTVRGGVNLATDDATLLSVLSPDELRLFKVLKDYSFANLPKAGRMLWDLPEDVTKLLNTASDDAKKLKLYEKVFRYNAQANETVDTYFRLQTFMYARDNPDILIKYGLANPQDLVRRIHFDPNDLSVVEKSFLKRVIPFYTFTKKNLAFQLRNVTDNPQLYKRTAELFDGVWKAKDIDPYTELEDFKREQFWLPIFKQEDGKYYALKLNLPIGDLSEFLNNPLQRTMSMFTPIIRAPFEMATNTQIFSGMPIQEFPGQKAYNLDFLNLINKVPGMEMFSARSAEYFLSQSGIDVPAALVGGTIKGVYDLATGEGDVSELISRGALQSAVNVGEQQKGITNRAYRELKRLQGLARYAKQENIPIPTMAEVENKRSPLNNLIKKIRIRGLAK
jgi:hypothetical protein